MPAREGPRAIRARTTPKTDNNAGLMQGKDRSGPHPPEDRGENTIPEGINISHGVDGDLEVCRQAHHSSDGAPKAAWPPLLLRCHRLPVVCGGLLAGQDVDSQAWRVEY